MWDVILVFDTLVGRGPFVRHTHRRVSGFGFRVSGGRISGVDYPMGIQSKPFFWSADWITCPSHRVASDVNPVRG